MIKNFSKMYNYERKVRFLEEEYPNEKTRLTYGNLLIQIAKYEEDYNKDLCDFSYAESTELMVGLKKKTYKSIDVSQTIIIKYIDWCINQGYSKTGINNFRLLTKDNLKGFVHKVALKNSFLTRDRIYQIASYLYNDVDKALLVLLFEGVRGRTEIENTFEELRNLRQKDVLLGTNDLILTRNNGEKRVIRVDGRTIDILLNAIKQTKYHKDNGKAQGSFATMLLRETGYILRAIERSKSNNEKIAVSTINTKFKAFRSYTEINFLNPTMVFQSGLLEKCEKKEANIGKLEPQDYRQIYHDMKIDVRGWFTLKELYESYKVLRS